MFVIACWGFGRALIGRWIDRSVQDQPLAEALCIGLGMGLQIVLFQALGAVSLFVPMAVPVVNAAGVIAAGFQLPQLLAAMRAAPPPTEARMSWLEKVAMLGLALVAIPSLVAPLAPPIAFDELMYHLPYARQVAESGSLGIHEWLRYPWFPYNFNLLYAAALMVGDDVLPHFLNALAGWLSVFMIYRLGRMHASRVVAAVGAAIWLGVGDYSNALIDMGVALFVLCAFVSLCAWQAEGKGRGLHGLVLAAFFLGLAAGSKYQALTFLPLAAVFVAWRERRIKAWALGLLSFLLPCIYWYARNAITTGDPFNPIGARIFGFTNWIAADYEQQLEDVRLHAALPSFLIWPIVLAPFSTAWRASPVLRAAMVFCVYAIVVWLLTSRYPRYLTAAYPLIALMAVFGWQVLVGWLGAGWRRLAPTKPGGMVEHRLATIGLMALSAGLVAASAWQTVRKVELVAAPPAEREAVLRRNVPGYAVMSHLRQHVRGRVYQVALSEAIYYGPNPIYGDALGPWRYRDFVALPPAELARKLGGQGFEAIVTTVPLAQIMAAQPGFGRHFEVLVERDGARAYRILP
ncbi:conserved membrane hypothetical protein [Burkholderiales bacterium 8X]|nr:conserved membrane hypothetical protein [Burkholderiales bacterium 8X]